MYYSNEDFENFYVRYKAEGLPRNICLKEFCMRNKVPWNLFDKWHRDTHHRIEEVQVVGRPEASATEPEETKMPLGEVERPAAHPEDKSDSAVRIMVDIRMSNGLHIQQRNLSHRRLLTMVEKLEALC